MDLSGVIHDHLALAIDPHQNVVVLLFDAELADDRALVVLGEFRHIQLGFGDFTGVTEDMGQHAVLGIDAALRGDGEKFGEKIAMGIDESQVERGEFLF
jgi:hypothetical protein